MGSYGCWARIEEYEVLSMVFSPEDVHILMFCIELAGLNESFLYSASYDGVAKKNLRVLRRESLDIKTGSRLFGGNSPMSFSRPCTTLYIVYIL